MIQRGRPVLLLYLRALYRRIFTVLKECLKLFAVDSLFFNEKSCTGVQHIHMLKDDPLCVCIAVIYQFLHLSGSPLLH